jgi:hypothetical protein
MKKAHLIKGMFATTVLVAGVAMSGLASAHGEQEGAGGSVSQSAQTKATADQSSGNAIVRGGYNVSGAAVPNVPGCIGPASFCNMYFGS